MSNSVSVQITEDGPRNTVAKVVIYADTSDVSSTLVLDPAALVTTNPPSNRLRIDEVQYSVQDGWYVNLFWDASTQKHITDLAGRGTFLIGSPFGGWINDAGTGVTGKINMTTTGYTSGTMAASFTIHTVKQTV
jgi:hypothetical protein